MVSKSYSEKGPVSILLGVTKQDYANYVEYLWDDILKGDLGVVAIEKATGKIVAVGLCTDVNAKHVTVPKKRVSKSMSYYIELLEVCEAIVR